MCFHSGLGWKIWMWLSLFKHFEILFIELYHLQDPLITQSDLGFENHGIADAQIILYPCQWHHPDLEETVQHQCMHSKKNGKPEIDWSQFMQQFTSGFENIIQGWCDCRVVWYYMASWCVSPFLSIHHCSSPPADLLIRFSLKSRILLAVYSMALGWN